MKGTICEWNNGKGYNRGLMIEKNQIRSLLKQKRIVLLELNEDFTLKKNEKGGNIIAIVDQSRVKVIGYQD